MNDHLYVHKFMKRPAYEIDRRLSQETGEETRYTKRTSKERHPVKGEKQDKRTEQVEARPHTAFVLNAPRSGHVTNYSYPQLIPRGRSKPTCQRLA